MEVMAAYFVSHLLNVSGKSLKNTITPMDLIKPLRKPQKSKASRKEDEEYLIKLFRLERRGTDGNNS